MPNVSVNGTNLEYAEQGDGPPVLLVHGGSSDLRAWTDVLPNFGAKFRAIAVSCRGYYPNEPLRDDEELPLDTHVQDLIGFVRALKLEPVHLVGHSSPGGFGSLLFAQREPGLLRSLVLAEPPAFPLLGVNIPPKPPEILRLFMRHPVVAAGFVKFGAKAVEPAIKGRSSAETTNRACDSSLRATWGRPLWLRYRQQYSRRESSSHSKTFVHSKHRSGRDFLRLPPTMCERSMCRRCSYRASAATPFFAG